MLAIAKSSWGWNFNSAANPSTTPGVAVTPGTAAKGSWSSAIATGANLANDVYGIRVWICAGNTSAGIRNICLDVGVDPAGGTNYSILIADILCSQASNAVDGGQWLWFPIWIKAGSQVAARAWSNSASTVAIAICFFGKPSRPELVAVGQYSQTLGAAPPVGTSFTPGNSGAEGGWVSLGSPSQRCWWWQICVGINNGTVTSLMYYVDLAYGDASNKHLIIENQPLCLPGTAERVGMPLAFTGYWEVPSDGTLYVRGACSGTAVTGFSAVAIGVGG